MPQRRKRFSTATHGDVESIVALPNSQNTLKPFQTVSDTINDIPLDNPDHGLTLDNPGNSFPRRAYPADTPLDATITTSGTKHHPLGRRHFTTRELASIQGFPLDHRFKGSKTEKVKQIGDAVPPPMARAILEGIKRSMRQADGFPVEGESKSKTN